MTAKFVMFGRDYGYVIGEALRTVLIGTLGVAAAIIAKLHDDTVFWGNLTALCTAMFVVIKGIAMLVELYYKGRTKEMIEQEENLQKAIERYEEVRSEHDLSVKRLEDAVKRTETIKNANN